MGQSDDFLAPDLPTDLESSLEAYEALWRHEHGSDESPPEVPSSHVLANTLLAPLGHVFKLNEELKDLKIAQSADSEWTDNNLETTNLRVGELETAIGEVPSTTLLPQVLYTVPKLSHV